MYDLHAMSDFAFPGFRQPKELDKIWLTSGFRAMIIGIGIEKAGSLNELGRQMGIVPGPSRLERCSDPLGEAGLPN